MIRPFHTPADIYALGLLVAKIQNGSGADRRVDEAVMALFFQPDERFIGARYTDNDEPALNKVWVNPVTEKWVSTHAYEFTSSLEAILRTIRVFLPETSWSLQSPSELPASAIVQWSNVHIARSALTPERALLTAFLIAADQVQRAAA